mgnify:CR=1 FL=1
MSQDKKKTLLEYTKTSQSKNTIEEIVQWFIEEKKKKGAEKSEQAP